MLNLLFRQHRMDDPAAVGPRASARRAVRRRAWRPWLRAIHRDIGHFVIGLTVIYAVSGLAVNHLADWDPNFKDVHRIHQVATPLPSGDRPAAARVLSVLGVHKNPEDVYSSADHELDIVFAKETLHVDTQSGRVVEEGQEPRPLLRIANWLHLNRGKRAWTYVADSYAVFLLYLAISGLLMMPGRKGLFGRGGLFALLGIALPVLYVVLSGGP